ncbi:SIS domain-containing protein [Rhodothermus sp. AH-315-K08]|nr:SIS domain-containing protein [Rhodothermus sp. AH-315-K08]
MKNQLDSMYSAKSGVAGYARDYFRHLGSILDSLDSSAIADFESEFQDSLDSGSTIFLAGNGGSATTSSAMANDLGFDLLRKTTPGKTIRLVALADNNGVVTAVSNDTGYENLFVNQLRVHFRPGDKLVVISASGNSENLIRAAKWTREKGGKVLGLLGFDGGQLLELCDPVVHFATAPGEYGPVEDAHLIISHVLAHWFQNKLR